MNLTNQPADPLDAMSWPWTKKDKKHAGKECEDCPCCADMRALTRKYEDLAGIVADLQIQHSDYDARMDNLQDQLDLLNPSGKKDPMSKYEDPVWHKEQMDKLRKMTTTPGNARRQPTSSSSSDSD
jgi:hypothetical protein